MTDTISADYSLRPSELASTLALLVEARQPVVVWGAPGCAKSQIAQQVAAQAGREYVDVRALLLDPVDLRGIRVKFGRDFIGERTDREEHGHCNDDDESSVHPGSCSPIPGRAHRHRTSLIPRAAPA